MNASRPHRTRTQTLAADKTVANYLDAMLHEATQEVVETETPHTAIEPESEPPAPEVDAAQPETEIEEVEDSTVAEPQPAESTPVAPAEAAATETAVAPVEMPVEEAFVEPALEETEEVDDFVEPTDDSPSESEETDLSRWLDNGRPVWGQEAFDCLVFMVDGLKLAVPLLLLGNIHPLDREMTPLFDQPEWFLGLLPVSEQRNIRVVDTARLVMPEKYRPESTNDLAYAVGVHGSDWAFGCHAIEGSITLTPDAVKWRSQRTRRPWLAGTVIDQMCALVDLHAFAREALA